MIMTNNFVLICISSRTGFLFTLQVRSGLWLQASYLHLRPVGLGGERRARKGSRSMRNTPHTASHIFVINSPEVRPRHTRDGERIIHLDLPGPPDIAFLCEIIPIAAASRNRGEKISLKGV